MNAFWAESTGGRAICVIAAAFTVGILATWAALEVADLRRWARSR